jgi:flagellar basal-body rod protein FlgC
MTVSSALQTAVSGLHAASRKVHVAANNIANANTPDFQPSEVRQSTVYAGPNRASGVQAEIYTEDREGDGGLSVATDFIRLIEAEAAYKANAATIEAADRMSRDSIDLLA